MGNKTNRSRLISLIHAQKNAAGLDDATYRLIISGASGKQSCTECCMKELKQIFTDLNSILEKQGKQTFRYYPRWEQPTLKDAVTARAKKILGEDWQNRLDSDVQYAMLTTTQRQKLNARAGRLEAKQVHTFTPETSAPQ